jgi:predicted O-methyltransferase YrrM
MRSSYKENNYGNVFRALILAHQPKIVVECGVLDGYSTSHIAHALRFNHARGLPMAEFYAYDLWEEYEYKHGDLEEVEKMLKSKDLLDYVMLYEGDAFEVAEVFEPATVDFLHIDISNHGEKVVDAVRAWGDKISPTGMIVFEGGSEERDKVEWMIKYKFPSIRYELFNNPIITKKWHMQIFTTFPSMTLMWRK